MTVSQRKELDNLKGIPGLWNIIQSASVLLAMESSERLSNLFADETHLTNYWEEAISDKTVAVGDELLTTIKKFNFVDTINVQLVNELLDCISSKTYLKLFRQKANDYAVIKKIMADEYIVHPVEEEGGDMTNNDMKIVNDNIVTLIRLAENGEYTDELQKVELAFHPPELIAAMEKYAEEHKKLNELDINFPSSSEITQEQGLIRADRAKVHELTKDMYPGSSKRK